MSTPDCLDGSPAFPLGQSAFTVPNPSAVSDSIRSAAQSPMPQYTLPVFRSAAAPPPTVSAQYTVPVFPSAAQAPGPQYTVPVLPSAAHPASAALDTT